MTETSSELSLFLDGVGDGVYTVDPDGTCLFANAAAVRILGYGSADELVGRNMHDLIHHTRINGRAYPRCECPLLHTARGGAPVRLENELLWRCDGSSFLAEYSAFPVLREGKPIGSTITFAENRLRHDARTRLLVQHAVGEVLAEPLDQDATMQRVLHVIGAGFGWQAGLFWQQGEQGRPLQLSARWQSVTEAVVPEPAISLAVRATVSGQVVSWSDNGPLNDPVGTGAVLPGMRSGFALPVLAGSGVFGALEFFSCDAVEPDPTLLEGLAALGRMIGQAFERQQLIHSALQSEARFRTIANTIPQLAWMTDQAGSIVWYNDRWFAYTGTTLEQMAGWGWMTVHHPEHVDRVVRNIQQSFAAGEPWEDTFPLRAADGSYRWFLSRAEPIRADAGSGQPVGSILGWFGSNTDITALRAAEQSQAEALDEAEAASQAKSLFLANMSHELRTPLSAIIGYSEMMIEEVEDGAEPDELVQDIRKIETNARHLLGLINDVLDLSKVESGKMEAFAETFDVAEMVGGVAATVTALIGRKHNRLAVEIADGVGSAHSDITRLRQVLLNLLGNAAKFTENGTVTLSAAREVGPDGADWLRFAVSDTGLGMTEEQLAKLFQRFQQADASTTRKFGGTGLGLSLTRAFSELLGGSVEVASRFGHGSTFTVRIPATLPTAPSSEASSTGEAVQGRQLVLVVDDDATQRELMSRFLDRAGYTVRTASNGPEGLVAAREHRPHAILLDVTMPGMDGWSVLTALKADPELADIPVVMVTLVEERALASSLGAAEYITKPVDWARLEQVLDGFRPFGGDVLVIDDDADTRQRLHRLLERNGWSVTEAENGRAGLDRVREAVPRLILLDLTMPVMDGFEFLERLRGQPGCGTVPVIVLSALTLSLEDRRRLRGANQILNKGSVSLNELMDKLRGIEALGLRLEVTTDPARADAVVD